MLTRPSSKKSLIVEQFQGNYLKSVLRMQFLSAARARNASQSCREVARLISEVNSEKTQEAEEDNFQEDNFPASTFKRLSK